MHRMKSLTAIAGALAIAGSAVAAPLTINLEGLQARGGTLYVSVQTEAQFMKNDGVAGDMVPEPEAGAKSFTYDLPEGAYSISVWHDFNGNGQFDMSEAGPPADGWSMIGAETMRASPTFADASLMLPATGTSVTLSVLYPE